MKFQTSLLICLGLVLGFSGCRTLPPVPPEVEQAQQLVVPSDIESFPETPPSGTLVLSLDRCLEYALGGNIDLKLGALAPRIRGEDFFLAGEEFEPVVFAEGLLISREEETANTQIGADVLEEDRETLTAGIRKTFLPGTELEIRWEQIKEENNSEFRTLNPSYDGQFVAELVQPLLQGFGLDLNRVELNRALNNRDIAAADFELLLESELLATQRLYWDLVLAGAELDLQKESLDLTQEQLAITRDQVDVGRKASLELTSALAAEARQQEAMIQAEASFERAGDRLLQQILPGLWPTRLNLSIQASSRPDLESPDTTVPSLRHAFSNALAQRAELKIADLIIDNADLDRMLAANRKLPRLDLYGQYGFTGLGPDRGDARQDILDQDFPRWEVGFELRFLFLGKSRAARFRQAVLEVQSEELRKQQALALILTDVRTALRDLQTAEKSFGAAKRSVSFARERYEGESDRYEVGRSTLFETESARRDLIEAERSLLQAAVQIEKAKALLLAAQGMYADQIIASIVQE